MFEIIISEIPREGEKREFKNINVDISTPLGRIIILGTEDNSINVTNSLLVLDLGGNDEYHGGAGATSYPGMPFSILIDIQGNDYYMAEGDNISQGAAICGTGILIDLEGDDKYEGADIAQGASIAGTGILYDIEGNDSYRTHELAQGASFFGIGMLAGGALLGAWGGFEKRINTMIVGTGLLGLMMVVIGTAPADRIFLAIGAMFLVGVGLSFGNGAGQALLQVLIVPDMQGRVFATLRALRSLMAPLGLALAGPFTEVFGMQSWMLGAGIGITIMIAVMPFISDVADIEEKKHP